MLHLLSYIVYLLMYSRVQKSETTEVRIAAIYQFQVSTVVFLHFIISITYIYSIAFYYISVVTNIYISS